VAERAGIGDVAIAPPYPCLELRAAAWPPDDASIPDDSALIVSEQARPEGSAMSRPPGVTIGRRLNAQDILLAGFDSLVAEVRGDGECRRHRAG
jgi:hypothetical protein